MENVTRWQTIPARDGSFLDFPEDLHSDLQSALESRGIRSLYSHQRKAYDSLRAGENTVVVTPTASGKTLSYSLPVLQTLLEDRDGRALYLFPTKALAQDQQAALGDIVLDGLLPVKIVTYDGDTPGSLRISARDTGRIIISNPDMLHAGILPNHPKWIRFFSNLRFIVIDEVHIYRGVFGSHMVNLLRRLKRICRFYGSDPVFFCASATIGNPLELACSIIEDEARLVDCNGAPAGERHVILYNPPLVDRNQGIRKGITNESKDIALRALRAGVKTIVFARSRMRTELIAGYINTSLKNRYNQNEHIRVESYRGGYLPSQRRIIEQGLREGSIHGVVSTNALELGIDIGGLDLSVLAGFPGSIASAWQQAGRAGRTGSVSVSILVASSMPVDQYMVENPEYFFGQNPESGWVDPENPYILLDHLKCAGFELPLTETDEVFEDIREALEELEGEGVLRYSRGKWYWADRSYPAEQVSLRTSSPENVVIVDTTEGKNDVIGEMDVPSAKELLFDGAVYLHQGRRLQVEKLDLENNRCFVTAGDTNYYTDSLVKRDIKVLSEDERRQSAGNELVFGDLLVRSDVAKYKKLRFGTNENVGYGDIFLPEEQMHTRGLGLLVSAGSPAAAVLADVDAVTAGLVLSGAGNLIRQVAPVFLLCVARDLGIAERVRDPHYGVPVIYLFDNHPGGVGLSEGAFEDIARILRAAGDRVKACGCSGGCPSCIGPVERVENAELPQAESIKERTIRFLDSWLADEKTDSS
ncbi:MAG: DEAD/DEAH box helicase [Spirochaetales bacterium]|nr:DEAD/DEAH box helicase [Spirochaetales bacterium]MCF7937581.1 DEAD/DEAH box helicase [Spirochaetales bacterium]